MKSIDLSLDKRGCVTAWIQVVDEYGAGIRGMLVSAVWDLPGDHLIAVQDQTSCSGLVRLRAPGRGTGTHTLNVLGVVNSTYAFDAVNSVLSARITRWCGRYNSRFIIFY